MHLAKVKESLYEAYLCLVITHSTEPDKEAKIRALETRMRGIADEFVEVIE